MARTVTVPERDFQVGEVSRTVDSFPADVEQIRLTITRVNWPGSNTDIVARVSIAWETGEGIEVALPGGVVLDRSGLPLAEHVITVRVPRESDGQGGRRKRNQVSGTATLNVLQPLRAAISAEAL